jgi:predicted O-linked N-acetylglucosamine transferase (SPINDLY family)
MACFCQLQKITPIVFDLWMETMAAAPSLVLWLFDAQAAVAERLRQRAAARGVDASRLRFAEFVPDHADHLARYAVADFAVDTFPYGSHTTAIDALWVGCPLIAWSGEGFASRVSGSVLRAGGCPELIANSADEYRDLILTFAQDPLRRRGQRQELLLQRTSSPLFDVAQFTRHYEALLSKIAEQGASGFPFSASPGP